MIKFFELLIILVIVVTVLSTVIFFAMLGIGALILWVILHFIFGGIACLIFSKQSRN